jgi:hypothetical protein
MCCCVCVSSVCVSASFFLFELAAALKLLLCERARRVFLFSQASTRKTVEEEKRPVDQGAGRWMVAGCWEEGGASSSSARGLGRKSGGEVYEAVYFLRIEEEEGSEEEGGERSDRKQLGKQGSGGDGASNRRGFVCAHSKNCGTEAVWLYDAKRKNKRRRQPEVVEGSRGGTQPARGPPSPCEGGETRGQIRSGSAVWCARCVSSVALRCPSERDACLNRKKEKRRKKGRRRFFLACKTGGDGPTRGGDGGRVFLRE